MITLSGRGRTLHLLFLLLSLCLLCSLLTEVEASEEEVGGRGEGGGGGGGGGGGRRSRASRNGNSQVNEIQRSRSRGKKGGDSNRRKVAQIQEVVSEVLEQQLEPLNTALRLVRLDTFTENVHRQLGTLEHIQSKLLTEYGELRAALTEVSRNTLELTKQVATLDARVVALDRSVNSQPRRNYATTQEASAYQPRAERLESDDYAQVTNPSDLSEVTDAVKEAVTSISNRLQATERRFKEDLATLENRTTEALKKSHTDLDRRMAIAGLDSVLILNTLDKLANKTCPLQQQQQQQAQSGRRTASLNLRGDAPIRQRPQRTNADDAAAEEDQLAYFPAEDEEQAPANGASGERVRTWLIREGGRPVTEVQTLDLSMVNRLASEIAKQMAGDDTDTNDQPRDCAAVAAAGETTSGVYTIYPASCTARFSVQVWCELEEAGGPAWTVIQRRGSTTTETPHPVVDFFRDWAEYKWGFGNLEGEYWLGNEYIHQLTQSGDYELRVDLQDWSNETRYAIYKHFALGNEDHNYTLSLGDYEGTAGNSLKYHQGAPFSTRDRDNDFNPRGHCARTFHGAWWFTACHESHLNGRYHHGRHKSYGDGINWMAFRGHNYSLKFSRMMIRRTNI